MLNQKPLIEVDNVSHSYHKGLEEDFLVLKNVSFTLYEDEIVCLLGRSGSGKSTLMKAMSGLLVPTKGCICMKNKPLIESHSAISMVFQNFSLFPWLSVLENVEIGLQAQNINPTESQTRSRLAINLIGLDGYEAVYPRSLSGGMQQRVGLARALVVKPTLLLMDEPFSALDSLTAEILRADLLDLWIEGQMSIKSIFMITHNIEEAVLMADRILIFGSNPGFVSDEIKVPFPHPRNRLSPEFRDLVNHIYDKMTSKEQKIFKKEGFFSGTGIGMGLPYISSNVLQGFMETIGSMQTGEIKFADLVGALNIELGEFLKIAEVLQLFRFCELESGSLRLTEAGLKFSAETIEGRKKLFQEHLEHYIPLAAHIRKTLENPSSPRAPLSQFLEEVEQYIPKATAEESLKAVISWARYAGLFMYDEQTQIFFLEKELIS